MENFLTILPRFLASEVGRGLLSTTPLSSSNGADTQQTTETFLALETALQQVQTARTALEPSLAAGVVRQPAEFRIVSSGIGF